MEHSRKHIADVLKQAAAYAFFRYGYSMSFEVGLKAWGSRRADILGNKINGDLVLLEVKSSVADFRSDTKWHEYLDYADRVYLVFTKEVARKIHDEPELKARIPKRVGVMVLEDYGYTRVVKNAQRVDVDPKLRMLTLARLAWRQGELSKRTTRARKRFFLGDKIVAPNETIRKVRFRKKRRYTARSKRK